MNPYSNSQELLRFAANRLKSLLERIMFVGGSSTWLHITDPASRPSRQTTDVDIVVEVARFEYNQFGNELRALGFAEDQSEGAPICRWRTEGLIVDVLPTNGDILGFTNRWYRAAMTRAREYPLEGIGTIRVPLSTDFLAMKLEAFRDRGKGDYLMSKDIEDIALVIDGRLEIIEEIEASDHEVRDYIRQEVRELLNDPRFEEEFSGHFGGDPVEQSRVPIALDKLRQIAGFKKHTETHLQQKPPRLRKSRKRGQ